MKKTAILIVTFSFLAVGLCLNGYAEDLAGQVTALEQKASRIQIQIEQAKKQNDAALEPQVKQLQVSVENLIQQRVRIDAQIATLEQKIQSLQSNSQASLSAQVDRYDKELSEVKQELAGVVAKRAAWKKQQVENATKPSAAVPPSADKQVQAAPVPQPAVQPAQVPVEPMGGATPNSFAAPGPGQTN
jgi:TolA-binding protein